MKACLGKIDILASRLCARLPSPMSFQARGEGNANRKRSHEATQKRMVSNAETDNGRVQMRKEEKAALA